MSALAVRYDPFRTLAYTSISGTYAAIGGPTTHLMRILDIVNNTNADIFISFDAVNDNIFVPANGYVIYDLETNSQTGYEFFLAIGTQLYVKTTGSPSSGSVYIMLCYGKGQ